MKKKLVILDILLPLVLLLIVCFLSVACVQKSILKAELERKMAEVQAEYQRKFNEVEAEHNTRTMEIESDKNLVFMNKLLANAFLSKCTDKKASHASPAPRGKCLNDRASWLYKAMRS